MTTGTAAPATGRHAVHERVVDGFGTVRVVPVDPTGDLELIYRWVTEERARFWGMRAHSRAYVLEIYEYLDSLTTHHAYLVHRDGRPVAIFQTYEPAADPLGDYYEVQPGDFGIHLMMGPADGAAQPGFTGTIMTVLIDHVLADPSVQRIVVEPDARNAKAIARFVRAGFELGPEIQLPDKPARLAFYRRT